MGHANSKPKKKGIEKERSRSRSFMKPKKKENNSNNVNNNDGNNENDIPSTPTTPTSPTSNTSTSTTSSPAFPPPVSLSPPPTPTPFRPKQLNQSSDSVNSEQNDNNNKKEDDIRKSKEVAISEKNRGLSNNPLRVSTVFEEDEKPVEIIDDDGDQDKCPLCEEETLCMHALDICGHSICIPCLYAYAEHQLKNLSPNQHEILCPVPECTCIISSSDLKAALDAFGAPRTVEDGGVEEEGSKSTDQIIAEDGAGDGGEGSSSGKRRSREKEEGRSIEEVGEGSSSSSGRRRSIQEEGSSSSINVRSSVAPALPIQLTQSLEQLLSKGNYVHCPNPSCKFVFEKLPHAGRRKSEIVLDDSGTPISPEASKHREEHRFRCRVCGTNFCAACKTVPYHLGFTCKQKMASMRAKHCRFCDVSMPANAKPHNMRISSPLLGKKKDKSSRRSFLLAVKWKGKSSKSDITSSTDELEIIDDNPKEYYVCKAKECTTKMGQACSRFPQCGHICAGMYNDLPSECFCLKESCCGEGKQNGTEFCNICWTEALGSAPCYKLACSHVFHASCITSKLVKEWPGPAISFAFMNCPLCTQVVQHRALDGIVAPFRNLFEQVKARALQRLEFEGMLNDPRVIEPDSDFFGKPAEYAMNIFSFYMCFVCRNPYFGGRRQCEVAQAPEGAGAAPFNPQELLCGGCSTLNAKCSKHGKEYIEYKCRFCCSLATFYCGGKAHFCTACHDKAGQLVEFINWTTTAKCEPCKGPGLCPLGMQHKENGEEFSLGCSICRLAVV